MPKSHPSPALETPSAAAAKPPPFGAFLGLLVGIFTLMLGLGLLGNEIRSITWRVKARFWYQEGVARVEKNEIFFREGAYELETSYHLERDGKSGPSIARLDPDDPSTPTREESQARADRLPVGSLQPCWYWPQDPDNYNIFAPQGLRLGAAWGRLWMPAVILLAAWELTRWSWRKLKQFDVP